MAPKDIFPLMPKQYHQQLASMIFRARPTSHGGMRLWNYRRRAKYLLSVRN